MQMVASPRELAGVAGRIVAILAGVYLAMAALVAVLPPAIAATYAVLVMNFAALAPVLVASLAAKPFYIAYGKRVTLREGIILFAMVVAPVAVMAWLAEAVLWLAQNRAAGLGLGEVLARPLAARATVTVLFGLSFLNGALAALLVGCVVAFPNKVAQLDRLVRQG